MVVALAVGLLATMGAKPVAAGTTVTAVTGSAYGYRAFGITIFGGAQPDTGPTPTEALASNASNSPQSGSATTALVQYGPATLLTGDAISLVSSGSIGASGSVSSSATAADLNKATTQPASTGSEILTADSVAASCSGSGSGTSGSATITNGSMVTDNSTTPPTVTPVPTSPAPNTSISGKLVLSASDTETFTYVFNEQTTDTAGNLTVNAVDEYLHGPTTKGNLIVGQAVCGVTVATTSPQTITFTSTAPTSAAVGGPTYNVTATGGGSGNPVVFTIDSSASSVCAISGSTVSFTGVGTCVIDANQAGNSSFDPAPQVQQSFAVGKASQTITFTSTKPTNAVVGGPTYTVAATASSGLVVSLTIDSGAASVCSISGATVSFTASGTCVIDGNQAGNASFSAAPQVQQSFTVGKGSQTITFTSTPPSNATPGGPTYTVTATASSGLTVALTIDSIATSVCSISGATVSFTAAGTCVIDANQAGSANFNAAPQVQQSFGVGKASQTITFTSSAPSGAAVSGPTYTVTATASSGLAVTLTIDSSAASVCSISGSTVSFTAAGTCVIDANQAGNASFNAAPQVQQSFAVGKGSQTITFTSTAPSGAGVGGPAYAVTATASSGLSVSFTIDSSAASVCSISGANVSFTAAGTCVINANQAGNASFNAAPQVQQSFVVGKGSQAITFTSTPPSNAAPGGPTYTVTATGGASGNSVTFTIDSTATSVCSISGSTVSFTAAGTCVIDANQAGNASYNAAPQLQQSFGVGAASQTITYTSTAPNGAVVGGPSYTVTATASSGLSVTFTIDSTAATVCSVSGATVSFTATGTCVVDANQAGNSNFNPAPQVQQSFAIGKGSQTITFTSTAPTTAVVSGPTYTVAATGGGSSSPVTFTIDSTAASVCSISGSTVSFTATGTCVIDANQAGNANFNAAPQVQQSFAVGKGSQTITFTSKAPTKTAPGGTYAVTATASSGLPVTFTIDPAAASVCSISGSTITFTAVGTCVVDANQAGDANFNAAPQVVQSFAVGKAHGGHHHGGKVR